VGKGGGHELERHGRELIHATPPRRPVWNRTRSIHMSMQNLSRSRDRVDGDIEMYTGALMPLPTANHTVHWAHVY